MVATAVAGVAHQSAALASRASQTTPLIAEAQNSAGYCRDCSSGSNTHVLTFF